LQQKKYSDTLCHRCNVSDINIVSFDKQKTESHVCLTRGEQNPGKAKVESETQTIRRN